MDMKITSWCKCFWGGYFFR